MNQNWTIKKMPEVVKWGSGGTPKATVKEYYENGNIPWLIIGDLNDEIVLKSESKITKLGLENSSAKMLSKGTLLVAMYGSIGKLGITGIECCTNQAIAFAKELHGVTTKFMYYQMKLLKPKLISMGKGGTQKNISQTVLNSLDVIVPPIEEQQHIITKIEELFLKLDKGVEELNKTKEQLKIYRQAVLKEAFEGIKSYKKISDLFDVTGGLTKNSKRNELSLRWKYLRVANVFFNYIDTTEIKSIGVKLEEIEKTLLKRNDLLFVEGNGSKDQIGRVAIWNNEIENCLHQNHIIKARPMEQVLSKFALYYLMSTYGRKQITQIASSTSGLYTLSTNKIKNLSVPICDIKQQEKVICDIEERLSVCDKIEQTVNESLQKAESLRQSILKQAFEGKLV